LKSIENGIFDAPDGGQFEGYALEMDTGDSPIRLMIYVMEVNFSAESLLPGTGLTIDGVLTGILDDAVVLMGTIMNIE